MIDSRTIRRMVSGLAVLSTLGGCASAADPGGTDEGVGESQEPILNGTVTLKRGVVQIAIKYDATTDVECTGALISPYHLVTAAHCIQGLVPGTQGVVNATIKYFDPDTGARNVTSSYETVYAFWDPDYPGGQDSDNDVGVIQRVSAPWAGTDTSDYLRLSLESCAQMDKSDFYGAGDHSWSGDFDRKLRTYPVNLAYCGTNHFFDLGGAYRDCHGDSGGPYIVNTRGGSGFDTVIGVMSLADANGDCTTKDGRQRGTRMNADKVAWIEKVMGKTCTSSSDNGYPYKRCW